MYYTSNNPDRILQLYLERNIEVLSLCICLKATLFLLCRFDDHKSLSNMPSSTVWKEEFGAIKHTQQGEESHQPSTVLLRTAQTDMMMIFCAHHLPELYQVSIYAHHLFSSSFSSKREV